MVQCTTVVRQPVRSRGARPAVAGLGSTDVHALVRMAELQLEELRCTRHTANRGREDRLAPHDRDPLLADSQ
eukprot:8808337-Heterocapsa_arctica.AAC.1